jgi:hypothetical protein
MHNDDDLLVRAFRDGVPDGQTVRRKMETVGARQRVCFGKLFGKHWDWFFEQMKDRLVGGVPKWLRQPL